MDVPDDLIRVLLDEESGGNLPSAQEVVRCRECVADFLADDDSGESVSFQFDKGDTVYRFESKTDHNGLVEGTFEAPGDASGWLTVTAEVRGGGGKVFRDTGRVRLLEPQGKSVVSDIDDTIKVSEIPAGGRIVLRNTFLRDYVVVEGMRDRYVGFGDVSFHYVSGSPWQMYRVLDTFLIKQGGFPEGTFHMKSLRKSLLDLHGFIRDIRNFVAGKAYTKEQKLEQISGAEEPAAAPVHAHRRFGRVGPGGLHRAAHEVSQASGEDHHSRCGRRTHACARARLAQARGRGARRARRSPRPDAVQIMSLSRLRVAGIFGVPRSAQLLEAFTLEEAKYWIGRTVITKAAFASGHYTLAAAQPGTVIGVPGEHAPSWRPCPLSGGAVLAGSPGRVACGMLF